MQEFMSDLIPPIAVLAFLVTVLGAGTLANCAVFAALLKHRRNGIFSILIQLCAADILLSVTLAPEIWTWNTRTWHFGVSGCTTYQGLRVFTSTSTLYLVVALALHTLATIDLEQKVFERRIKRAGGDDDEMRSSRHSLVADSDTSTPPRTMNVDYRITATRVPATLPTIFVWILAASLSIPEFVLSLTVHADNLVVCTLESTHKLNIYSMLAVFTLFLPFLILGITAFLSLIKFYSRKKLPLFVKDESKASLKLSLWLMFSYVIFCGPRSFVDFYSVYSTTLSGSEHKTAPVINLGFCCVCLLSILVRPLIYIFTLPQVRKQFTLGFSDVNVV